ncbi:RNA polymerase III RPC4-domain-containing protein [Rostrohypoxylon terebratum]|nr:RNA polymerase III RPC4-domain-containing protein [Rostrohypoxylon terebratum]
MPPRGPRAGTRGRGRGRGRGSGRAGHADATDRAADSATAPNTMSQSPAQDSEGSDLVMQGAAVRPIEISATPEVQPEPEQSTATSATQSRTPSIAPSRVGGRFRPKNVRRDAVERLRLEEERNRDLSMKIKEEEREQRAEDRRARRGRGRGGFAQRGLSRRIITASGPFSGVPQENINWGPKSGHNDFSSEYASTRYKPRRENEHRINVDTLSGYTEDGSRPFKSRGIMPVGLLRIEHEEEEVKVKTTAELEAEERQSSDDEDLFLPESADDLRNAGMPEDSEVWHAAPKSQVKVKTEPGTDPDAMDIDMSNIPEASQAKAPNSPEAKRLVNEVGAEAIKRKRKSKAAKDPEIAQTIHDLQYQLNALRFQTEPREEKGGEEQQPLRQSKDDQVMLFQLPPILPPLARPASPSDKDMNGNGPTNATPQSQSRIKTEDDAKKEESSWNPFGTLPPEGGRIGKLIVRKSGKVEFDWGGTTLSLGAGAEAEFTTTALMVEQNVDLQNPELSTGFACGMGEITSKFVLAPVWDEEEDWDPSLEDIGL